MSRQPIGLLLAGLITSSTVSAQVILFQDEFDGAIDYNPDSTTAMVGDEDWVDTQNRLADPFSGTEGHAIAVGGTETVLTGEPTSGDPQIRTDFALGVNKSLVGDVTLRIRADINQDDQYDATDALIPADVSLFYTFSRFIEPGAGNGPAPNSFGNPTVTAQADGWHLFTWPDAGGITAGGAPNIEGIRLDPLNNLVGVSFEIDSFTITETANPPPLIELNPGSTVGPEFTVRQEWDWTTDGDLDGWAGTNFDITLPGDVAGGIVTGISTNGDPQFTSPAFAVPDVTSGRFVIEIGILGEPGDTTNKQLFWGLNGGGFSAGQSVTLAAPPDDGNTHLYRITYDDDINGVITRLRFDPSNANGITSRIDFVRIYSEGPEIGPPASELDPAALDPNFALAREWTFDTDDDLQGWAPTNWDVPVPNNGTEGVFGGAVTGTSTTGDPQFFSPILSITEPPSTGVVVEIDFLSDPGTTIGGTLFWSVEGSPFSAGNSVSLPVVPSDGSPHTVRVTFDNDLGGTITNLRIDPANEPGVTVGIDAIRIYRDVSGSDYELWASTQTWPFGAVATSAAEDFDGDGVSNGDEYLFGLDPASSASLSPITTPLAADGTFAYTRRNPALTGATFSVWTSTDLLAWTKDDGAISNPTGADVQTVSVQLSAAPIDGKLFVRVEVE